MERERLLGCRYDPVKFELHRLLLVMESYLLLEKKSTKTPNQNQQKLLPKTRPSVSRQLESIINMARILTPFLIPV